MASTGGIVFALTARDLASKAIGKVNNSLGKLGAAGKLAATWLPSIIVYCDAVPKGPTGKVQRIKLSSMLGLPTTFPA